MAEGTLIHTLKLIAIVFRTRRPAVDGYLANVRVLEGTGSSPSVGCLEMERRGRAGARPSKENGHKKTSAGVATRAG